MRAVNIYGRAKKVLGVLCLAAEFQDGGDPSLVQKWTCPIGYALHGDPTPEDLAERFIHEAGSLIRVHEIFSSALEEKVE